MCNPVIVKFTVYMRAISFSHILFTVVVAVIVYEQTSSKAICLSDLDVSPLNSLDSLL